MKSCARIWSNFLLLCHFARLTLKTGDAIYAEISEYLELQNLLEKFSEVGINEAGTSRGDDGGTRTMVDMGCNFYIKAQMYVNSAVDLSYMLLLLILLGPNHFRNFAYVYSSPIRELKIMHHGSVVFLLEFGALLIFYLVSAVSLF